MLNSSQSILQTTEYQIALCEEIISPTTETHPMVVEISNCSTLTRIPIQLPLKLLLISVGVEPAQGYSKVFLGICLSHSQLYAFFKPPHIFKTASFHWAILVRSPFWQRTSSTRLSILFWVHFMSLFLVLRERLKRHAQFTLSTLLSILFIILYLSLLPLVIFSLKKSIPIKHKGFFSWVDTVRFRTHYM